MRTLAWCIAAAVAMASVSGLPLPGASKRAINTPQDIAAHNLAARASGLRGAILKDLPVQYFTQKIDHENPNNGTFKQRYWVNDEYVQRNTDGTAVDKTPVFAYICGEGACSSASLLEGQVVNLAAEYGGLLVTLEHRGYGWSQPYPKLNMQSLRVITSTQSQLDWVEFLPAVIAQAKLAADSAIITYGGSYSGAMSSWMRKLHPDIITGAYASSGPVLAQVNFEGYNEQVDYALRDASVGGSDTCADTLRDAFATIEQKLLGADVDRAQLADDFCLTSFSGSELDAWAVMSQLAGDVMGVVQYSDQISSLPLQKIDSLCYFMNWPNNPVGSQTSGTYAGYDKFRDYYRQTFSSTTATGQCKDLNNATWAASIAELANEDPAAYASGVGARTWTWQTCNEFGYFQTCDSGTNCVFGQAMNLNGYMETCQVLFNVSAAQVNENIAKTNAHYGGNTTTTTRVLWMDGTGDPWHKLTQQDMLVRSSPSTIIPGASHCQDMSATLACDSPGLTWARYNANAIIGLWLAHE